MTKEIVLWFAFLAMALIGVWLVRKQSAWQQEAKQQAELESWNQRPSPLTEAELAALARGTSEARFYSAIKNSKRIQVTRSWRFDPEHTEVIVGEPLVFGVDHNGCGWVTIKKDDGHVTHIMHFIADGVNSYGMEIVEVKFT